ncbi:MAG: hypothetical protein POH28_10805 [Acidocella sp.]|nr:hypothetical protein [Acidocella sp.]
MAANQDPGFIDEAATLLMAARSATLGTIMNDAPYVALVTPALDERANMLLLLSDLSVHTAHLRARPACALLVSGVPSTENPQTAPRLSLTASAAPSQSPTARARFLQTHPYAAQYIDFGDFNLWLLNLQSAHYVGGFAAAATLDVAALQHKIIMRQSPTGS